MANEIIWQHFENALSEYSKGHHLESLLEAKDEYFSQTGTLFEEDDEYESRMNCFNDWYVFQFLSKRGTKTVMMDYLEKEQLADELSKALLSINHSLFEFIKINMKGLVVIKDILHDKKITLAKDHHEMAIIEGDLFTGRMVSYEEDFYFLKGLCIFPNEAKSILKKQAKRVRKKKSMADEANFLLTLENLKTKWLRYGHVEINKIFVFDA